MDRGGEGAAALTGRGGSSVAIGVYDSFGRADT